MRKVRPIGFYMLRDLDWPFGQGFHAWRSFLAQLVFLIAVLVSISPILFILALCRLRELDWNPLSRYRKQKRKERLEQVGKEWEEGREERNRRRIFPNILEGKERDHGLIWNGEVDKQDKSSLYKLPREVRDMIWKEATGEYLVHLTWLQAYRRFDVFRCKGKNGNCIGSACQGVRKGKGVKNMWGNVDLLSYLLVCRKMYEETLLILYRENYFQFRSVVQILRFSLTIPVQQMSMIQKAQWEQFRSRRWDALPDENSLVYRTFPRCKGVDHQCYCLRCWKKEDWQRHYNDRCNSSNQPVDVICSGCWLENPASRFWY